MDRPRAWEEWTAKVRLHTLAAAHGPDEAERLVERSRLLVPELPADRRPGLAARVTQQEESLLLRRRPAAEGGGVRPRTDEERARDSGLSVERWQALAR